MKIRRWWLVGALIASLLLTAAACTDSDSNNDDPSPGETTSADGERTPIEAGDLITPEDVLAKDPGVTNTAVVDWGWMFELSGPPQAQGFGIPTGDGVKQAVQEINDAGGFQVGDTIYTINLIEHDTKSDIANTVAVAQELVQDDGVKVIFGPATLGEPEATRITQASEVIHLCPCQEREQTALDSVEKARGESRWAFQTLLPFSLLIEQAARDFQVQWPEFSSMALVCQNTTTGRDICERTRDAYAEQGVEIVEDIQYFPAGTTDYTPFLTKLQAGDPDYLFNYDDPINTAQIVKQALQLGVGRLHLVTIPASLAESLIGVELTVPVSAGAAPRQETQPLTQEVADYFDRYREFKGGELPLPAFPSLMMYDYVYMVAAAMQRAGTVDDTTAIAAQLEVIHYDGVAEDDLFFNSRHMAVHGTEPCIVQTGVELMCEHNPPPPEAAE